jgi:AcrR family transcriptional regulator
MATRTQTSPKRTKGEATRQRVYDAALGLFRRRGFERTTMRDIAAAAGLSLGAAYHYFRSKDDIVVAYADWMQAAHEADVARAGPQASLHDRLAVLFHAKLTLLRGDQKLLAAVYGSFGDTEGPRSVFGASSSALRARSIAMFVDPLDGHVPDTLQLPMARALWLAHLGVFLYFIQDRSPSQGRTVRLVDALVSLAASLIPLISHPLAAPLRGRLLEFLALLDPSNDDDAPQRRAPRRTQ